MIVIIFIVKITYKNNSIDHFTEINFISISIKINMISIKTPVCSTYFASGGGVMCQLKAL